MLNVAMISYHTCPLATLGGKDTGGMNVYVRDLTCQLGRMGIHVDVFTRSQDEHVPHVLHDLGYGNRVVHIPAGPETPVPKADLPAYLPQFIRGVRQFAGEKGIHYDVIHSHYWLSGVAAEALSSAWCAPVIQMFHTLGIMKNRIARSPQEMEGEYRIEGERQVIRSADRIVAATPAEREQLEQLYQTPADKIVIVPPGVDTSRFYPIPQDEARAVIDVPRGDQMLLFVGRIEPLKGVDILIEALACMVHSPVFGKYPHYLAIIGGDPDVPPEQMTAEMARLQALSRELGLEELVIFLGKRSQDSLPYYYSAADVLVMPSLYESFGMVALEAMACGTPVVASRVGGLAYLVQDGVTGFHVPDGNARALCDTLERLVQDETLRRRMGRQAAEYARGYAWEKIAPRIVDIYQELLRVRAG